MNFVARPALCDEQLLIVRKLLPASPLADVVLLLNFLKYLDLLALVMSPI